MPILCKEVYIKKKKNTSQNTLLVKILVRLILMITLGCIVSLFEVSSLDLSSPITDNSYEP